MNLPEEIFSPESIENNLILTPYIRNILTRAKAYLDAGFPIHFRGPSGTGKTSMALFLAARLGRSVVAIHGNDDYFSSDLIGGHVGFSRKSVIDNYIHTVSKMEENIRNLWVDGKLTTACRYGYTLIYDEFSRSRPETNNILLSILEEKFLDIPDLQAEQGYVQVHPNFRAIFTSNPEEYAGVHKTQDALRDRLITIDMEYYDRETEIMIARKKSGLYQEEAAKVVDLVRDLRQIGEGVINPSIRAAIKIATVAKQQRLSATNELFQQMVIEIILSETRKIANPDKIKAMIKERIQQLSDSNRS